MELTEIAEILEPPYKRFNGDLILEGNNIAWTLSFIQGQLLYASDKLHPVRRWNRNLGQHFPKYSWRIHTVGPQDAQKWQIPLLDQGITRQQLSLVRAKLLIRTIIQECLFELSFCNDLKYDWRPGQVQISQASQSIALSSWEVKMTFGKVNAMQKLWQNVGLQGLYPTLSPTLKPLAGHQDLPIDRQYLNGDFTIWDVADQVNMSFIAVAALLVPRIDEELLEFQAIPDAPLSAVRAFNTTSPSQRETTAFGTPQQTLEAKPEPQPSLEAGQKPVIACIDDSPVLTHSLKKILVSAGYEALVIEEPMRGFSQLIEQRPALILLDLMLPNADGYSVCKFLRDTPVFKNTPIIILTGKSKSVDRARARLAGATEFLVKPPHPRQLLTMIDKCLAIASS